MKQKIQIALWISLGFILMTTNMHAQRRMESTAINMEFVIPKRFMKISEDKKATVYQDSKTKAILTMEKLGFSDFDTEILLQVEMDYNDLASDENNVDIEESSMEYRIANGYIIDWKTVKRKRYRDNDANHQSLLQLNGTLYRFTISYPSEKRRTVLALFDKTLNSAVPIYD